jgi:hypothetical protein
MVINPFIAGVLWTIFVEMALLIILAIIKGGKK